MKENILWKPRFGAHLVTSLFGAVKIKEASIFVGKLKLIMPYQQQQQQCPGFQPNKCFNNNIIFYNIYNTIYFQTTPTKLFSMYENLMLKWLKSWANT